MPEPCRDFRGCEDLPSCKSPFLLRERGHHALSRTGNKPTLYRADDLIPASKEPPGPHPTACI